MNTKDGQGPMKRAYTRHPFSQRKRVVSLYESGMGSKRIAKAVGLDDSLVRKWLRCYRHGGLEALRPMREDCDARSLSTRLAARIRKEQHFDEAFHIYSTTLEPVASIARRFHLNYREFKYHIVRHRPDLMEKRACLKNGQIEINQ